MKLSFKALSFNLVMAFLLAVIVTPAFGPSVGAVAGAGLFGVGCLLPAAPATPTPGLAFFTIQQAIWVQDIQENVFPDNGFITKCRNDGEFLNGRTVVLPQAGSKPGAQKNRTSLPATASKRSDGTENYDIDEFTSDPVVITLTEVIEASYNKRQSVLFDHLEYLRTIVGDNMAYRWAASQGSAIVRTTGAGRAGYKSTQTGQRLRVTKEDFANASRILNRMDVPKDGRVALVDADLEMDVMLIPEFVSANIFGQGALKEGVLGRVFGFDIMSRSRTTMYSGAGAPKSSDLADAGTDCASIQLWHPGYVRGAWGSDTNGGIHAFYREDDPTYYGDVLSAMVRAGGKIARTDQRGVVSIVEAAA